MFVRRINRKMIMTGMAIYVKFCVVFDLYHHHVWHLCLYSRSTTGKRRQIKEREESIVKNKPFQSVREVEEKGKRTVFLFSKSD